MKTLKGFRVPFIFRTTFIFHEKYKNVWYLLGIIIIVCCLISTILLGLK